MKDAVLAWIVISTFLFTVTNTFLLVRLCCKIMSEEWEMNETKKQSTINSLIESVLKYCGPEIRGCGAVCKSCECFKENIKGYGDKFHPEMFDNLDHHYDCPWLIAKELKNYEEK